MTAGRPTYLTITLTKKIVDKVREGVPPVLAAIEMGVERRNFYNWLQHGRTDQQLDIDSIFREFLEALDQARAAYLSEVVVTGDRLLKHGKFTSVKDFVLWLERLDPEHFRKRETTEVIGKIETTKVEQLTSPEDEAERLVRTLELLAELGRLPRPALQEAVSGVVDAEIDEIHPASTAPETSYLPDPD